MSGMNEGIINVSKAMGKLAKINCRIAEVAADYETQIASVKYSMEKSLRPMMDEDKSIRAALEAHFSACKGDIFDDKTRSLKFPHGVIGYRLTPPTLVISSPKTLVARLKQRFGEAVKDYLKVVETPRKDTLKTLAPEIMKELKLKITQENEFYITLDVTATENIATGDEEAA